MAFVIPYDLIKRLQITLREEANVSSYDPGDPSLPDLPSIEQSISELDPSPPHLRCNKCKARLLRGLQSVACVFCGQNQRQELPPDPINFNSTCGYNWFLKHLDLNESDMVEPALKAINSSSRRKPTQKEEIPLSNVLDLEIKWPAGSDILTTMNDASLISKSSLNLVGINLDNYISDANIDTPSSSNSNVPHGEGHFGFSESVQPSDTAGGSTEDNKSDKSFSGWQADFQPANSGTRHVELKSADPFVGSGNDIPVNMDAVFGPTKDASKKPEDTTTPSTSNVSDFFQGDPLNNANCINVNDGEKVENDVEKVESANNSSSTSVGWIQEEKWPTSDNTDPIIKNVNEDDSFDVWNDFSSSTTTKDPLNSFSVATVNQMKPSEQSSETNLFSSPTISPDIHFGSFSQADSFSAPFSKHNDLTGDSNDIFGATFSGRMGEADVNKKDEGYGEGVAGIGDAANVPKSPEDRDAEALMSQMHDLSFMLDSNLLVPPKLD